MTLLFHSKLPDRSGFSLISMMLVILAISLAAVLVLSLAPPSIFLTRTVQTRDRLSDLKGAILKYYDDHGGFYPVLLDLLVLDEGIPCEIDNDPGSPTYQKLQGWCGPYLDPVFAEDANDFQTDGWGTLFEYDPLTGAMNSCGPDLSCGNGDDIADP
jgi:type II secretory pathway pseudopilin PulG